MKKTFRSLLSTATILLLSMAHAHGQDSYWLLDGKKRFSTTTGFSTISSPAIEPEYIGGNPRAVFNSAGEVMFSYGTGGIDFAGIGLDYEGGEIAFPISDSCKKYFVIGTGYVNVPHGSYLKFKKVDASTATNSIHTSGLPTVTNTNITTQGHPLFYGSTAAPAPNGAHYVYYLTGVPGGVPNSCSLSRYLINPNGSFSTTPDWSYVPPIGSPVFTHILSGGKIKVSQDGTRLGYTNVTGNLVVISGLGTVSPTADTFVTGGAIYGMMPLVVGAQRRWYVSTGSALGYFTEGSASFTTLSTSMGLKTDITYGKDGAIYFANGNPGSSAGTLYRFPTNAISPLSFSLNVFAISGGSNVVYSNGSSYSFGNILINEDINNAHANPALDFRIDNIVRQAPATCNPQVLTCPSQVPFTFTTPVNAGQQYSISWRETNSCGSPWPLSPFNYTDTWHKGNPGTINLATYGNGTIIAGLTYVVTVVTRSSCNSVQDTQRALIQLTDLATQSADYKISNVVRQNPSCSTSTTITCPKTGLELAFSRTVTATEQYKISWVESNSCGVPFASPTVRFDDPAWHNGAVNTVDLAVYGNGSLLKADAENKWFVVSVKFKAACFGNDSVEKKMLIKIPSWKAKFASWYVPTDPSNGLDSPRVACSSAISTACVEDVRIEANFTDATSYWLEIRYYASGVCGSSSVTIADATGGVSTPAPGLGSNSISLVNYLRYHSTNGTLYPRRFMEQNPGLYEITLYLVNTCDTSSVTGFFRNLNAACKGGGTLSAGNSEWSNPVIHMVPNPARGIVRVDLKGMTTDQLRDMRMYDITGKEVMNIKEKMIAAGSGTATIDVSNLPSGVYVYRYTADNASGTGKLTIID